MKRNYKKCLTTIFGTGCFGAFLGTSVFAQIPQTGDGAGVLIPIMGGLLGVSLILAIVYFVLSKKKK